MSSNILTLSELDKKATHVPASVLKKRKANEERRQKQAAVKEEMKKKNKAKRGEMFKRAERYVREYRQAERSLVNMRRMAKKTGNFYVEPEAKLALVVRIKGILGVSPKVRKILQLLRLRQVNNAVLVRLNKATLQMLQLIVPYIAWGYPSLKTVKELVYKRGYAKVRKQRVPITDNSVIENALGHKDIICIEDLIHELYTVGPAFKEANNFLWPFKLSSPNGGFNRKLLHYNEGGDAGLREHEINKLVRRML
eukprot:gb/GECG01010463.1/.p1 GENE.gb/GECG01010463.1/~~gb/GECG01010463.1/.p1  ORF type:complete len:253 (+),score=34.21 gb/GECG01010463.1/:1-759(+)